MLFVPFVDRPAPPFRAFRAFRGHKPPFRVFPAFRLCPFDQLGHCR
jgi:hypothetical protein